MERLRNFIRNINYLSKHSLWDQREEDIVYLTNKILDDGIFEYDLNLAGYKKINICSKEESLVKILKTGKSFVRFNDGEIRLMMGVDQPFQRYDEELAQRLMDILANPKENLLVGLNREYFHKGYDLRNNYFIRRNSYDFRSFFQNYCNLEANYIDGACTFFEWGNRDEAAYEFWTAWKNAFKDKDIVIVCGEHILDKLEYDVFEMAKSKKFIFGPKINAWDEHRSIIEKIKQVDKRSIIIFILGMGGKAMIPEVTDLGYVAWDIGHMPKSYNAFMTEMPITKENIAKFYAPD